MKTLQGVISGLLVFAAVGFNFTSRAQTETEAVSVSLIDELPQPQLMDAGTAPLYGTYFMLSDFQRDWSAPPYPCNPFYGAPVYSTAAEDIYIVDDSEARPDGFEAAANIDLATLDIWGRVQAMVEKIQDIRAQHSLRTSSSLMTASSIPSPEDGEGSTNGWYSEVSYSAPVYGSNDLWLEITGVSNSLNQVYLTVHGTVADVQYEILSRERLEDTTNGWTSEGLILGLDGQTPTTLSIGTRTTNLFFWCRSWQDTDGSGMPDWWQMQFFGTLSVDPYGDNDGDGWTNLQEYQNGTNPLQWNIPAAPQGFTVNYDSGTEIANGSWFPSPGSVQYYIVVRDGYLTNIVDAGSSSFEDVVDNTPTFPEYFGPWIYADFQMCAHYAQGDSQWTENIPLQFSYDSYAFEFVAGANGKVYLASDALPGNATAVRITKEECSGATCGPVMFDIPVAAFTNGVYEMPSSITGPATDPERTFYHHWYAQVINDHGSASDAVGVGEYGFKASDGTWQFRPVVPFYDGRQQLKQNLKFLLRTATSPFHYSVVKEDGSWTFEVFPTEYAQSSFLRHGGGYTGNYSYVSPTFPFERNYLFRNFVFAPADMASNGKPTTGAGSLGSYYGLFVSNSATYRFEQPLSGTSFAALLDDTTARWIFEAPTYEWVGITYGTGYYYLNSGTRNAFGLLYDSARFAYEKNGALADSTLNYGSSVWYMDGSVYLDSGTIYYSTAVPAFQNIGYYFGQLNRYGGSDPMPGAETFSNTIPAPPIFITGIGQQISLAASAVLQITNGYSDKIAYLGQYFDRAYMVDTNGNVTSNDVGIVSPYGDFFPTNVGPAGCGDDAGH